MSGTHPGMLNLKTGSLIAGRYAVQDKLGEGGMGQVFRVLDTQLNNESVALKVLHPKLAQDGIVMGRFRNEVLVARRLNHPNITRIYDFGESSEGLAYLTMEFVEGRSLGSYIYTSRAERLVFEETLEVLFKIASGLSHAHQLGIIHRDLKPDNILITPDKNVKLTDFGLARLLEEDQGFTRTGEAVGTPYYMSPEQLRGLKLDARCDVYAFGILAFEAIAGRRPFQEDTYLKLAACHLKAPIPLLGDIHDGIPEWMESLVCACMQKEPDQRIQNMNQVLRVIAENRSELGANTVSQPAMSSFYSAENVRRKRKKKSSWLRYLAVPSLAMLLLSMGMFAYSKTEVGEKVLLTSVLRAERLFGLDLSSVSEALGSEISFNEDNFIAALHAWDLDSLKLLLDAGMDSDSIKVDGLSALEFSLSRGQEEVSNLLIDEGVDTEVLAANGLSPLMMAVEKGLISSIAKLAEKSSNLNRGDDQGVTALMRATERGEVQSVQVLLSAGASPNPKNSLGETALMLSARKGDLRISQMLIDRGALVNDINLEGKSALWLAAEENFGDVVRLLLKSGANSEISDIKGRVLRNQVGKNMRNIFSRERRVLKPSGSRVATLSNFKTASSQARELTRLRLRGEPQVVSIKEAGRVKITSISAKLRNVGEVAARGIRVVAKLPNGRTIDLGGPGELPRKKTVDYFWSGDEDVTREALRGQQDVKVELLCSNCRSS